MLATEVIKSKRAGNALSGEEILFFIDGYTRGDIPDYQMSSLLMAIFLNGMNSQETIELTQTMLDSGTRIDFNNLFPVDKHSTGGVGDKTSLILAPIVAACGVPVPMMSGRGLGHTGGTLDKLESIPGFNVSLDLKDFQKMVTEVGLSFIGQTENICPADKKIYSLRDVTATVESLPLICASIMSKKIAEGIKGLVLDVKVGSGAFMKTLNDAKALAEGLIAIGQGHDINTQAVISNMDQPLGRFVGNSLEIGECLSILERKSFMGYSHKEFNDTETLSLELSSLMIATGLSINLTEARSKAKEALDSGKAFEKFQQVCQKQGGDLNKLPLPRKSIEVTATSAGFMQSMNSEKIGLAGICLGAGRRLLSDVIDPTTGIEICKKIGEQVQPGNTLYKIHLGTNNAGAKDAVAILQNCYQLSSTKPEAKPLILERL